VKCCRADECFAQVAPSRSPTQVGPWFLRFYRTMERICRATVMGPDDALAVPSVNGDLSFR